MKISTLFYFFSLLVFCSPLMGQLPADPVNAVVGDTSWYWKYGTFPTAESGEQERVTAHLEYAYYRLNRETPDTLSPALALKRQEILQYLREYAQAGIFPGNTAYPVRKPCFIDEENRICAVGYLLEQTAGRSAAEAINQEYQYACVSEMDPDILTPWAHAYGLSLRDLSIIQPAYGPSVHYPTFIGNTERDLQAWAESTFDFPAGITEETTLEIRFQLSQFGNPQWPVEVEGNVPKPFLKQIQKEVLKMKFSPYSYNGVKQEFAYQMNLHLFPKGTQYYAGKFKDYTTQILDLQPADPTKSTITLKGQVGEKNGLWQEGATLRVKDSYYGAISGENGTFSLTLPREAVSPPLTVWVEFLDYRPVAIREIPWNDQEMQIYLEPEPFTIYMYGYPPFEAPQLFLQER